MGNQKKILIVKMSAIGDVIHTLPALNAIRRQFPDAWITWLVEEAAADIVSGHGALDRVIVSKRKEWIKELFSLKCSHALKSIRNFIKEFRNTQYDMIIDFQTLLKSGIMVMLAKGDQKIGFDKGMEHAESSHIFYHRRVSPVSMEIHALERGLLLLRSLNIPCKKIEYKIPVTNRDKQDIDNLLMRKDLDPEKPVICINPQATWGTKLWDNKKFAILGDTLKREYHAQIVFTGGKSDQGAVKKIISMMKLQGINFAGLTTLKNLAALYEKASLLITTDTGPMHLAAAMGTKIVAVFGPTAPWRTGPHGRNNVVVRSKIDCSPCFKRECSTKKCMKNISVDDVMKGVKQLMGKKS